MAKYFVTEERPATVTWTYEVEATSEEDAVFKVINNEVTAIDSYTEVDYDENEATYDVKRINKK